MNGNIQELIQSQAKKAKSAMRVLSRSSADVRNNALFAMAESLQNSKDKIQEANRIDLEKGEKTGLAAPLMQRLLLDNKKIERMVDNLRQVAALPDPIGAVISMGERPNGLKIGTVRVLSVSSLWYMNRVPMLLLKYQHSASSPETGLSSEAALKPLTPTRRWRISSARPLLQKAYQMPSSLLTRPTAKPSMNSSNCQTTLISLFHVVAMNSSSF